MKIIPMLFCTLLICPAVHAEELMLCGDPKATINYVSPDKKLRYTYVVFQEWETMKEEAFGEEEEEITYKRQLPRGLYMFRLSKQAKDMYRKVPGVCIEVDTEKKLVTSVNIPG